MSASRQQGPAAQPGAGSIVLAQAPPAQGGYQPGTLARSSQECDKTNRAGPAVIAQGPVTADGQAAVVPAREPNSELLFCLFARAQADAANASRGFAAAAEYAQVSLSLARSFCFSPAGFFSFHYSLAPEVRASCRAAGSKLYLLLFDWLL